MDIVGGAQQAALAITAALFAQKMTGEGRYIDVSMTHGVLALMATTLSATLANGESPKRGEDILTGLMPFYDVYETKDNRYMALGAIEYKFWERFCTATEKTPWLRRHLSFGEEAEKLRSDLQELFRSKSLAEWTQLADEIDCCLSPVWSIQEALASELIQMQGMEQKCAHPSEGEVTYLLMPTRFANTEAINLTNAPQQGEHTEQILNDYGYSQLILEELRKNAIIK